MDLVMSAVAGAVGAYLAAGATAKMLARAVESKDGIASVGPAFSRRRRALPYRTIGAAELGVAAVALWPGDLQRLGLTLQALLLTTFVAVVARARSAALPCGCFGSGHTAPRRSHVAIAVLAAAGAWTLVAEPLPLPIALAGLVVGGVVGLTLTARNSTRGVVGHSHDTSELVTRRTALAKGAAAFAAIGGGLLFGWKYGMPAGATSERRIKPRRPSYAELLASKRSELAAAMLADHGVDASAIEWEAASWYDDQWPTRTVGMLIAPIKASTYFLVHVPSTANGAPEGAALLQQDLTGTVRHGDQTYRLDNGRLASAPSGVYGTSRDFEVEFIDCLTGAGQAVLALCCALCGYCPGCWGPCCGSCAIGVALGCLWVSIT